MYERFSAENLVLTGSSIKFCSLTQQRNYYYYYYYYYHHYHHHHLLCAGYLYLYS